MDFARCGWKFVRVERGPHGNLIAYPPAIGSFVGRDHVINHLIIAVVPSTGAVGTGCGILNTIMYILGYGAASVSFVSTFHILARLQ